MSTDDKRSVSSPQLKHSGAGTLKKCHDFDTWRGPMGRPSHDKRGRVIWAQGRDLDAFKYLRKPLGLWVFSIFHPNALSRGPRGQGLQPCTGLSPATCTLAHTKSSYYLPKKIVYNACQLTSIPEAEHIFHEPFGRSKHAWFLACTDAVCRIQTHNATVSDDEQTPTAASGAP